ncbi:hypothetical protein R3W88_026699 [Solanum pinnatisectum]|uniref:Uncharacterized protein n=1 Tax=Solanum pinnatisectum TaxID=50273 RepID=A0AAV9LHE8_9SOLN|nr:hypothetical protein R3W88_026699 [Solanum pinnatisectum]
MAFRKSSDVSYKDSTDVVSADLSHVGSITQRKFKNSRLDRSEYFTSLEAMKNNNSHTMVVSATPRGNFASVFFGEFSQIGSNFGESEDSMDSPTSMNVNALMANSTDMDKKFAMMEQTIEALKKSIDDKNLHTAQLMNKLETFKPRESSHVPTCPFGFDQRNKDEKQSASVAALFVQQLQDMITNTIRAQYSGTPKSSFLTPIEVDFPRKTLEGSLEINNHKENEADGWTLVTHKKRRHQAVLRIRLPKIRTTKSDVNQLQPSKSKVRRPITLDEFFPKKFFCGSQIGATHVISSTDETKGSKVKFNGMLLKCLKKRTKEVSIKLSPSKGDMQTNIDDEQPIFRYIPCERRKKGQPLLEECTQQEKITVPVAQVSSFTLEPSKGNTQVGQIKGNFDQKVFTLFEKSGELTEEVTGEKIHRLTKSQMRLRKQRYYVATPKVRLGFSLLEPLRISSKKGKEITSSHYTSIQKTKESKKGKTPQWTSVFERIRRLTPRVSAFERLSRKDEKGSSKQVDEYATTSKTSVFHR